MKKIFFIFLALFLFQNFAFAKIDFPKLTGRVVDNANILNSSQKQNLTNILQKHEKETSNQIVVVTLKSLKGYDIAEYGYQLGRYWGIGQKNKNNGVLLIVSMKERKLRIEVGYGLEGKLTDKSSYEIIEYTIKPEFKKGHYYEGILKGVNSIIKYINSKHMQNNSYYTNSNNDYKELKTFSNFLFYFITIGFGIITLLALPSIIKRIFFSSIFAYYASLITQGIIHSSIISQLAFIIVWIISFWLLKDARIIGKKEINSSTSGTGDYSSGGSFGGGGFSGGGFSGGGGSFGGGGASGGW